MAYFIQIRIPTDNKQVAHEFKNMIKDWANNDDPYVTDDTTGGPIYVKLDDGNAADQDMLILHARFLVSEDSSIVLCAWCGEPCQPNVGDDAELPPIATSKGPLHSGCYMEYAVFYSKENPNAQ